MVANRSPIWRLTTTYRSAPSKKQFGRKQSLPLNDLVVFIDRSCGGKKIAAAFADLGFRVIVQIDQFPDDASDIEILEVCGTRGWIYVTQDFAIQKNPAEIRALEAAKVHAIFLSGRNRTSQWVIDNIVAGAAKLIAAIDEAKEPLPIEVFSGGRISSTTPADRTLALEAKQQRRKSRRAQT